MKIADGKKKKKRADELLLLQNEGMTLEESRRLIMAGKVYSPSERLSNPSQPLDIDIKLKVKRPKNIVSRGESKLRPALISFALESYIKNQIVLDLGASTGGFTQTLLEFGAKTVIAVDVGYNQMAYSLRTNPAVIPLERVHVKDFVHELQPDITLVVCDISFNSLAQLASHIARSSLKNDCFYLLLVKPQFELPRGDIPKGGVVIDARLQKKALEQVVKAFEELGFLYLNSMDSEIRGHKGNQETFVLLSKKM